MVAVVATLAAVLASTQVSSGVSVPAAAPATSSLAAPGDAPSPGTTAAASAVDGATTPANGSNPMISGDGRWLVFSSVRNLQPTSPSADAGQENVFVRDLRTNTTRQLSLGNSVPADGSGTPQQPTAGSTRPSISDDGRYVSFLTDATNVVPTSGGTAPLTLVLCDRDPDGDRVFDEAKPDGSLTNTCKPVYSRPAAATDAIFRFDTPQVAGFGGRVAWTQNAPGNGLHVWSASVSNGGVLQPGTPVQLPMNLADPDPARCGARPAGAQTQESQPAITDNASEIVVTVGFQWGNFCSAIVGTNNLTSPAFATSTRYDLVPNGCGTGFLGDHAPLGGACAGGSGGEGFGVGAASLDDFGGHVLFEYHDGPIEIGFAGPHAAAPTTSTDWIVLTTFDNPGFSAQVVSRDNAGSPVNSFAAAISEDGRYVAFETAAPTSHDGADLSSGTNQQIVARDLVVDGQREGGFQSRLPGALVTPRDPSLATPANCTPAAGQSCASAAGTAGAITMDATGARISYASSATDLVGAGAPGLATYVRTWQPRAVDGTTNFGTIQTGANKVLNAAIRIEGFGPLTDPTLTLAGPDAADFSIIGDTCPNDVLHVNDPCTVTIRFAPATDGPKQASLRLSSPQLAAPIEAVALAGAGGATGPKNAAGDTVRTSVGPNGGQAAEGGNQSMVSGNGRWDVFVSRSNLANRPVSPDSGQAVVSNVFVRDLADPQHTLQISLHAIVPGGPNQPSRPAATPTSAIGANPNRDSFAPTISSSGRFVSFVTAASDIVPFRLFGDHPPSFTVDYTAVVCDRDPDGDGIFDERQAGRSVPDYVCFPIQSGGFNDGSRSLDLNSRPTLAGNGSRITYVETDDNAQTSRRVRTADLLSAAGKLVAPSNFTFVPSTVPDFEHGADRTDGSFIEQTQPVLTEDGSQVVYDAVAHLEGPTLFAVIEANLDAGTDRRVDGLGNANDMVAIQIDDGPAVSDDGNRVAFSFISSATGEPRVFVSTIDNGTVTRQLVSRDNSGAPAAGRQAAISGDGRYVAFQTQATDSHNGVDPPDGHCNDQFESDLHVVCQIVARDLVRDAQRAAAGQPREPNELVSTSIAKCVPNPPAGRLCGGNDDAANPSIDNTGSEIGFDTAADDIVPNDTNVDDGEGGPFPVTDAFVHTWRPTVTVPTLAFGAVNVGASKTKTFTATIQSFNGSPVAFGPVSLGASSIVGTNPGDYKLLSTTCTGTTLHEGPAGAPESCTYTIRFTPTAKGNRVATLQTRVAKNGFPRHNPANTVSFDPALVRTLTGFGAIAVLVPNPATVDFGTRLPEDPVSKTVVITNPGSSTLVISGVVVKDTTHPGAKGDYTVDASDCLDSGGKTAAGGSCVIVVTFRDHRVGIRDAVLVIDDNTLAGSTSIGLLARTRKPTVESNPAVSPVRRVITVTGTGFAPNHEVEVGFDGVAQDTVLARANGSFELQLVVLPNGPQGPRLLFGHSTGYHKSIAGDFPFLVALGSTDPGAVVIRD